MSANSTDSLICAIREGSLERVNELIASSGLSNALPWSDGYPLLAVAISNNHPEIVKLLLMNINTEIDSKRLALTTEGREALSNIVNIVQFTILELTVISGDAEILRMLLAKCEDNMNLYANLLLHVAVRNNKMEDVRLLVNRGADVNLRSKGLTPLHIAVGEGFVEIAEYLLSKGARTDRLAVGTPCLAPLDVAIDKVDPILVKLLLARGASVKPRNKNHKDPLKLAFHKGHSIITAYVYVCSLKVKNESRVELLDAVDRAKAEYREVFQRFFRAYSFDSFVNHKSLLPIMLHAAAHGGFMKIVEYFVSTEVIGFDVNTPTLHSPQCKDRQTLLHSAVKNGQIFMAELLVHYGADADAVDSARRSAIFYAIEYVDVAMTRLLIGFGAKIRDSGYLLRSAAKSASREIVEIILERDPSVDINDRDCFGNTALHAASIGSLNDNYDDETRADITKLLLNRGADVDARGYKDARPLHFAVQGGRVEVVETLLAHKADVNVAAVGDTGATPLHECARYPNNDVSRAIAEMLLDKGANVDAKTKTGRTPLYRASAAGNAAVAEILLKHGADVNAPCNDGTTALHAAFNKGFENVVGLLLEFGADINVKSDIGKTPPEYIIGRFIDTDWRCTRKCRCKILIDIFKKEIIKMRAANLHVCKENLDLMSRGKFAMVKFEKQCESEIRRLRMTKVSGNASFYDILTKSVHEIAIYARYRRVIDVVEDPFWNARFPIYIGMIWKKMEIARNREVLLSPGVEAFNFLTGHELLDVLTIEIFSYLGNEDIENLIEARRASRGSAGYVDSTIKILKSLFVGRKIWTPYRA